MTDNIFPFLKKRRKLVSACVSISSKHNQKDIQVSTHSNGNFEDKKPYIT